MRTRADHTTSDARARCCRSSRQSTSRAATGGPAGSFSIWSGGLNLLSHLQDSFQTALVPVAGCVFYTGAIQSRGRSDVVSSSSLCQSPVGLAVRRLIHPNFISKGQGSLGPVWSMGGFVELSIGPKRTAGLKRKPARCAWKHLADPKLFNSLQVLPPNSGSKHRSQIYLSHSRLCAVTKETSQKRY